MKALVMTIALTAVLVACGGTGDQGIAVTDARVGEPTGPNAAFYFTASGGGEADRIIGAEAGVATSIDLHETVMGDDGTMGMKRVEGLDLPAEGDLVLEPGGLHLMLIDVERLQVGDTVDVTLEWEKAGEMTVTAEVVEPDQTMAHDG